MHLVSDRIEYYARKFLADGVPFALALDGYDSRKGWKWLEHCKEKNIEVIQSRADTSHFLQPCDQLVNLNFQQAVRTTRDTINAMAFFSNSLLFFLPER